MWVVKLGGSLQGSSCLSKWLAAINRYGRGQVVIVAGGGKFADAVRHNQQKLGFDDKAAHLMALLAMEQYAHLLKGLVPEIQLADSIQSIHTTLAKDGVALWLPYQVVAGETTIPASWDVTSDALAAWLAIKMGMDSLILVKSAALPGSCTGYDDLASQGLVDRYFSHLIKGSNIKVNWLQKHEFNAFPAIIDGRLQTRSISPEPLPGMQEQIRPQSRQGLRYE